MQYIALQVVVVLVNRLLGEELVFWPQVRGLTISKGSGLRNHMLLVSLFSYSLYLYVVI